MSAKPPLAVHLDLDGATDVYRSHGWDWPHADDPIFTTGLAEFLQLFEEYGVTATLFVVAQDIRNPVKRRLLETASSAGHELASHTVTHRHLPNLTSRDKREEIFTSKAMLEDAFGRQVHGFRAPGYQIDRESIELLDEAGYDYDSSAFPTKLHARRLGLPVESLTAPGRPLAGRNLVEWPMPDHRPSPLPFNPSYAIIGGNWYFRWGLARYRKRGVPLALLYHLVDASAPLPAERLNRLLARLWTISTHSQRSKARRVREMLEHALANYQLTTTMRLISEWRSGAGNAIAEAGA
ncbi:MAG: polysaccharide deacetylase family protein [Gemmatimonadota bacterium]